MYFPHQKKERVGEGRKEVGGREGEKKRKRGGSFPVGRDTFEEVKASREGE